MTGQIPYSIDYLAGQLRVTNKLLFLMLILFAIFIIIYLKKYISDKNKHK